MSLTLSIQSAALPSSLECVISNQRWQELIALLSVTMPDGSKINQGATTPPPADQIWPWFRDGADGLPDRTYRYANGAWLARHPYPTGLVCLWEGSEASIVTLDGGEAGAITATTGAFWEKVSQMDARSPMGPGTLPSGQVIAVGGTFGEEKHALVEEENALHKHDVNGIILSSAGAHVGSGSSYKAGNKETQSSGSGTPHNTVHPVYGIWAIRRTARLYYRAP